MVFCWEGTGRRSFAGFIIFGPTDVMEVFTPGDHGSTFGGNPLAAAVGLRALQVLEEDKLIARAATLGAYFHKALSAMHSPLVTEVRGKGLLIGLVIDPRLLFAREICLRLLAAGILSKDTHGTVVRLAPPLIYFTGSD